MFSWDSRDEYDRMAQVIGEALIPFLCERTGLSAVQIQMVLDAQSAFWTSQAKRFGAEAIAVWMQQDDAEEDD